MKNGVRADKWLWAVRICKTRNIAAEYCRGGKVTIGGEPVKPSRLVKPGDLVQVRKSPYTFSYRVTGLIEKRVSAAEAASFVENLTPKEELDKIKTMQESAFYLRDRGTGRPTKKERRVLDKLDQTP